MDLERREHDRRERDRVEADMRHDIRSLKNAVFKNEDTGADGLVTRVGRMEAGDRTDRWLLRFVAAIVIADAAGLPIGTVLGSIFGFGG